MSIIYWNCGGGLFTKLVYLKGLVTKFDPIIIFIAVNSYNVVRILTSSDYLTSRQTLDSTSKRANPDQWCSYATAKFLINMWNTKQPERLYSIIRNQSYLTNRNHGQVFFFRNNRRRIGGQSLVNRVTDTAKKLTFPWMFCSKDRVRVELKKTFFPYYP